MEIQESDCAVNDVQAAELLNFKVQTLRNWRFQGRGPAYHKIGRRVVYLRSDLEKFLKQHRVEPGD